MNNLVQPPMQTALPVDAGEQSWKQFWTVSSLYYSTLLSVLSPLSAIGALVLLNHFLTQQH